MKALRNLYIAKNPHIRTFSLSQNVTSISHNGRFHAKYESVKVELLSSFFLKRGDFFASNNWGQRKCCVLV